MSALETAREIGRIASTATLGKDVIDLLEKKVALLTQELIAFEAEKNALQAQNSELKKQVRELNQQLDRLKPKENPLEEENRLEGDAVKMLDMLFNRDFAIEYMAEAIGIERGMAEYHRDSLVKRGFIKQTGMGFQGFGATGGWVDSSGSYGLTSAGREFVVKSRSK